jgi:hypothetical protein
MDKDIEERPRLRRGLLFKADGLDSAALLFEATIPSFAGWTYQ